MISINGLMNKATSSQNLKINRIDYLDGWRGLAILFVLISHFIPSVTGADLGRFGVDIFFVLSGLLMSKILFVKRVSLKTFYKRRISRILPVFIIFVVFMYVISLLLEVPNERGNILYTLLFLRSYFPVTPDILHTGLPIGHLWSLNVEEHCYIILSVITLVSFWKGKEFVPLIVLGISTLIVKYGYSVFPNWTQHNYDLWTQVVASHLLISAAYFLVKHHFDKFIPSWLPIVTFIGAFTCYLNIVPWFAHWLISPFLLAFTVNHLDKIPDFIKSLLSFKPLRLLGVLSYSIYIWQQPFHYYVVKSGELFPFAGLLVLPIVLIVGALSFYGIENPVRDYINNTRIFGNIDNSNEIPVIDKK